MPLSPTSWGTGGGGGGGGVPAGSDGEIQFNDAGAFGASPDFTWDGTGGNGTLALITTDAAEGSEPGLAAIETVGAGVQLQISAADGGVDNTGGEVSITAGSSDGNGGGDAALVAGNDAADGAGGNIQITSGSSIADDGGDIAIRANGGFQAGNRGGDISIIAGNGASNGGNVLVQGGINTGNVQFYSGDGNQAIQLDNTGLNVLATKVGFYGVAPVVQPAAPVTIFDVIAALKALGLVAT